MKKHTKKSAPKSTKSTAIFSSKGCYLAGFRVWNEENVHANERFFTKLGDAKAYLEANFPEQLEGESNNPAKNTTGYVKQYDKNGKFLSEQVLKIPTVAKPTWF